MKIFSISVLLVLFPFFEFQSYLQITSLASHGKPNSKGRDQAFKVMENTFIPNCELQYWNVPTGARLWGSRFEDILTITWKEEAIGTNQTIEAVCECNDDFGVRQVSVSKTYNIVP